MVPLAPTVFAGAAAASPIRTQSVAGVVGVTVLPIVPLVTAGRLFAQGPGATVAVKVVEVVPDMEDTPSVKGTVPEVLTLTLTGRTSPG